MTSVGVSAIYLALNAWLLLALTLLVIHHRRRAGVGLGDGGDPALQRAIRAHGNAIETMPLQLLLLLLLELAGYGPVWLHLFGAAILASRLLHALGMSRRSGLSRGRFVGTVVSILLMLLMPALLLWKVLAGLLAGAA